MKKAMFLLCVLVAVAGFSGCTQVTDEEKKAETPVYSIGDTVNSAGIQVSFLSVKEINDTGIIAIHIQIRNTTSSSVDYSSLDSWGSIVCSDGSQLEGVWYMDYDNYFSGDSILPGATVSDVLTFDSYSGSSTSFILHATPPFDSFIDFQLSFLASSITTETY